MSLKKILLLHGAVLAALCLCRVSLAAYTPGQTPPAPTALSQHLQSVTYGSGFRWSPVTFNALPVPTAGYVPYVNSAGTAYTSSSGLQFDGTEMGVGGAAVSGTGLTLTGSGAAYNGLTVQMPSGATGNALQVKSSTGSLSAVLGNRSNGDALEIFAANGVMSEQVNGSGDFYLLGGSVGNPRFFGGTGYVRFSPGDQNQCLQGGSAVNFDMVSWPGIRLIGSRATGPPPLNSYSTNDPCVNVINTRGSTPTLVLTGASGQTADALDINSSTGTNLAKIDKSGNVITTTYVNSPAYQVSSTPGLTANTQVTTPTGTETLHFQSGLLTSISTP